MAGGRKVYSKAARDQDYDGGSLLIVLPCAAFLPLRVDAPFDLDLLAVSKVLRFNETTDDPSAMVLAIPGRIAEMPRASGQ